MTIRCRKYSTVVFITTTWSISLLIDCYLTSYEQYRDLFYGTVNTFFMKICCLKKLRISLNLEMHLSQGYIWITAWICLLASFRLIRFFFFLSFELSMGFQILWPRPSLKVYWLSWSTSDSLNLVSTELYYDK